MPWNNDISQLDSLLPAMNIKQNKQKKKKKSKENFLILFLSRLGTLTSWFPLDYILPYNFWKYSLISGISTLKYDIHIHKGNHLNRETTYSDQTPTPSRQLFLHSPTQCTWTQFNFFYY